MIGRTIATKEVEGIVMDKVRIGNIQISSNTDHYLIRTKNGDAHLVNPRSIMTIY